MESVEHALPSWPGLRPRPGGELVLLLDDDPLADGRALLLYLVARALRQGHRVCCLSAAPASRADCAAVLRKLGGGRAQVDGAFLCLPLLPPLCAAAPGQRPDHQEALLRQAAGFWDTGPASAAGHVLVLDDLSLAAGVLGPRAAVELVQACRALLHRQRDGAGPPSSLLVRAMAVDDARAGAGEDGGTTVPLLPLLLRHADVLVEVRPLASGYSRDVHGLIRVRAGPTSGPELVNFRLGEAGIRCDRITTSG